MENDIKAIEKHQTFQKWEWVVLRIFWMFMGLVLTAAVFGLFGNGYLSKKEYLSKNLHVEYNQFMRVGKETEFHVGVKNLSQDVSISINNNYLKKVRITQVVPEPATVEIRGTNLIYRFSSVNNGFITFYLSPLKTGFQELELTVAREKMKLNQYIYF